MAVPVFISGERSIKAVVLDIAELIHTAFGNWNGCRTPFTKRSGVFFVRGLQRRCRCLWS
jgi:hypothetical protein